MWGQEAHSVTSRSLLHSERRRATWATVRGIAAALGVSVSALARGRMPEVVTNDVTKEILADIDRLKREQMQRLRVAIKHESRGFSRRLQDGRGGSTPNAATVLREKPGTPCRNREPGSRTTGAGRTRSAPLSLRPAYPGQQGSVTHVELFPATSGRRFPRRAVTEEDQSDRRRCCALRCARRPARGATVSQWHSAGAPSAGSLR